MRKVQVCVLLSILVFTGCGSAPKASPPKSPVSVSIPPTTSPEATPTGSPEPTASPAFPFSLSAIQRLNAQVGFIVGWTGSGVGLAKTRNDGATWTRITVPTSHLTALRFIDEQTGWVAGLVDRDVPGLFCYQAAPAGVQPCKGVVLRTQDGGESWQTVLAIPTDYAHGDPILQLQAVDGERAWILALDDAAGCQPACTSVLRRTTDGGANWTTVLRGPIEGMRFASANRGWIALGDPAGAQTTEVRVTSDGGTSWQSSLRASDGQPYVLDAASIYTAWILTRNSGYCSSSTCTQYSLYRSSNGGINWTYINNPHEFACSAGHLAGPLFASQTRGWLGLNLGAGGANAPGGIMRTDDGGRTWRCSTSPPNVGLISAADPLHVWAAGEDRTLAQGTTALYTTDDAGTTWHRLDLSALR